MSDSFFLKACTSDVFIFWLKKGGLMYIIQDVVREPDFMEH